jgi:hypothetical protein
MAKSRAGGEKVQPPASVDSPVPAAPSEPQVTKQPVKGLDVSRPYTIEDLYNARPADMRLTT